ncbi:unnamed protein product [Sympodiomycopsis kandeliae]
MFLLGQQLPDNKRLSTALTSFYGIGFTLAKQLCARIQLNADGRVGDLSDSQVTLLSAYLSSGSSIPARTPTPTRSPFASGSATPNVSSDETPATTAIMPPSQRSDPTEDPLRSIVVEGDLRRQMRANIKHLVQIGTYRGKRHQAHKPVRGQRTKTNGLTAKKLNRIERRNYSTMSGSPSSSSSREGPVSSLLSQLSRPKWS